MILLHSVFMKGELKTMKIIKRSGKETDWDIGRIYSAITKANETVDEKDRLTKEEIVSIGLNVQQMCSNLNRVVHVEEIQDMVENNIMKLDKFEVARHYITYRYERMLKRNKSNIDDSIRELIGGTNEVLREENSNKNPKTISVQRDYAAGEVSKDYSRRYLIPPDIMRAHDLGIIHIHDLDYYFQRSHNCDLINLEDMLMNTTVISDVLIDTPHSFSTACNVATQIVAQVASSQYGGQSITLTHLAPFVDISRQSIKKDMIKEYEELGIKIDDELFNKILERKVKKEINKGVQTIQYQVVTLMTTNGQAPFITLFMYLNEAKSPRLKKDLALIIEEVLKQRLQGVKNKKGVYIAPAFPKLIYVTEENNITEDSEYWYLTKLAAECTTKRLVPDYISEKIMKSLKNGDCYTPMGCRSVLTPDRVKGNVANALNYKEGEGKYYGRFNQGVVTVNLVDAACSSGGDENKFWSILDDTLELCYKALMIRHNYMMGTTSDIAPILWQHGALARLKEGEKIDKLLVGGYSTISLGYAGLYECTMFMKGVSHTDEEIGMPFALSVMQHLNDACNKWKAETDVDFSLYGTPLESTTYKFAKTLQKRFGVIKNVTDHNYITNSYHVNVREEINAYDKLAIEAKFQRLSPGGAISYVEVPDMSDNVPAILDLIQFMYDNIMYAEINTKSDYCMVCGYDKEMEIVEDEESGKLFWRCPNCGNTNQDEMCVARRTCGYIGSQFWNQGRTQEIRDRVLHLSKNMFGDFKGK